MERAACSRFLEHSEETLMRTMLGMMAATALAFGLSGCIHSTTGGAATGAVAGAVVAGPVGALVGGATGAVVGRVNH